MFRRRHDDNARYFFVHLQKTAGTSLYFQLREAMGARAVYPDRARGDYDDVSDKAQPVIAIDHLERRWAARRREIRVVTGHFPMCTTDLLDADFRTFTLLRDPVERTLSYLRHHLELYPDDGCASIEDVYDDDFRFHGLIHNHMVKMFSLTVDEMDDGALTRVEFGSHHLQRAKENLARVDVVGFQERLRRVLRGAQRSIPLEALGPQAHEPHGAGARRTWVPGADRRGQRFRRRALRVRSGTQPGAGAAGSVTDRAISGRRRGCAADAAPAGW